MVVAPPVWERLAYLQRRMTSKSSCCRTLVLVLGEEEEDDGDDMLGAGVDEGRSTICESSGRTGQMVQRPSSTGLGQFEGALTSMEDQRSWHGDF